MAAFGLNRLRSWSSSLVSSGGPPVAIDFGSSGLKVLQLGPGPTPTLEAAGIVATPEELQGDPNKRIAHQLGELPKLVKELGLKGRRAICSIPSSQTFCKHMQIQPEVGMEMGLLVSGAVSAQLGCAPEALLCRHVEVGAALGGTGKSEVIALAAGRGLVQKLMDGLRAAKLELVGMHPEYVALLHCFGHITRRESDGELTSLYIDLGAGGTRLAIAQGSRLVFAKQIHIGGRALDELVSKQLSCGLAEANRQRLAMVPLAGAGDPAGKVPEPESVAEAVTAPTSSEGFAVLAAGMKLAKPGKSMLGSETGVASVPPDQRAGTDPVGHTALSDEPMGQSRLDLREAMETLTDEISMCLRYHEALFPGRRPGRVIFVGGEARQRGLCQQIARIIKAPAHVADPMARVSRTGAERCVGVRFAEPQPGWAVAMGLSLSPTDL